MLLRRRVNEVAECSLTRIVTWSIRFKHVKIESLASWGWGIYIACSNPISVGNSHCPGITHILKVLLRVLVGGLTSISRGLVLVSWQMVAS